MKKVLQLVKHYLLLLLKSITPRERRRLRRHIQSNHMQRKRGYQTL